MRNHNFFALLLFFWFSHIICAEQVNESVDTYWVFDKVSKIDAFGKSNENARRALAVANEQISIEFTNNAIIIQNGLLEAKRICVKAYTIKSKTPLNYFFSEKTVNSYNAALEKENDTLSEQIKVIRTGLNDNCPSPYEEMIENKGRLIIVDEYYLVFFKKGIKPHTEKSNCKNLKEGQEFDGTLEYSCFYPNQSLKEVYAIIVKNTNFLNKELPYNQLSYKIKNEDYNNIEIDYKWINQHSLRLIIDLSAGNEVRTYHFEETSQGTKLYKVIETQY